MPILEEHQYKTTVINIGINDLRKGCININVTEIVNDIIDIVLSCRSHNIATTIFLSNIFFSTKISHTKIQKLKDSC